MKKFGTLYLVPTPIGHLSDLSLRAVSTLKEVDLIACEHPLHSQRLLKHYQISTRTYRYHQHNETQATAHLLNILLSGKDIALISDAGTPLMCDPGLNLVKQAREQNIVVCPIPGPCAAISALIASGLPTQPYLFLGFLPPKTKARHDLLLRYKDSPYTLIAYEAPHRLYAALSDCLDCLGPRPACLARELTKRYETIHTAPLDQLLIWAKENQSDQGECVLIFAPNPSPLPPEQAKLKEQLDILCAHLPTKQACQIGSQLWSIPKNTLYALVKNKDG